LHGISIVNSAPTKDRLLAFIVAYNAEKTIAQVLRRIPTSLADSFDVEILVIDDASQDRTFEAGRGSDLAEGLAFKLHVLTNPVNQGYGGNQKLGYHFAIDNGFDFVALIHGDGQYAPESLPDLLTPLAKGRADAVLGSRMLAPAGALKGGMPLYKFAGNRILTWIQNRILRTSLSEFHTGYKVYRVDALKKIPFELNSNVFHFDTEIIIQLVRARLRIIEVPIPTHYGNEISHVNGFRYAWDVVVAALKARAQDMSLFYDRKFDCDPADDEPRPHILTPIGFDTPHSLALKYLIPGKTVVDLACAGGHLGAALRKRNCVVTGIDTRPLADGLELDKFMEWDIVNRGLPDGLPGFDYFVLLDVVEKLNNPEDFVDALRTATQACPRATVLVSTGNVGFALTRLMLLFGSFNYSKRGVLDLTYRRLYTFSSLKRLFVQAGFEIIAMKGVPAPYPLAIGANTLSRSIAWLNRAGIVLSKRMFSYQILLIARPRPSLAYLMAEARRASADRVENLAKDRIVQRAANE
jgi:2-polyprenyl-3-methyl-5-hydroxy-6-metoxy-1,4-benzoquinol methylase